MQFYRLAAENVEEITPGSSGIKLTFKALDKPKLIQDKAGKSSDSPSDSPRPKQTGEVNSEEQSNDGEKIENAANNEQTTDVKDDAKPGEGDGKEGNEAENMEEEEKKETEVKKKAAVLIRKAKKKKEPEEK